MLDEPTLVWGRALACQTACWTFSRQICQLCFKRQFMHFYGAGMPASLYKVRGEVFRFERVEYRQRSSRLRLVPVLDLAFLGRLQG